MTDHPATTSLFDFPFPASLNTSRDNIAEQLYNPAFSRAVRYDRGVGYFTSGWLTYVAAGLASFAAHGGKMRLITSPHLAPNDWSAIKQGEDGRLDPVIHESLSAVIDDLEQAARSKPLSVLAWMIADGLLELKIAIPTAKLGGNFHTKIGVFEDPEGNFIAFSGSPNETAGGFENYETLHIHQGWTGDRDAIHAKEIADEFNRLWERHDPNVRCYELPSAIKKRLVKFAEGQSRPYQTRTKPAVSDKWRHQDDALAAFMKQRSGVLAMATGTGKTRTALKIDAELRERGLIDTTIVAAYGTDLLDQWYSELLDYDPVKLIYRSFGGYTDGESFRRARQASCLIANRRTLADIISRLPREKIDRTLLICDEVHGFGEAGLVASLNGVLAQFPYRLGLSATPDREYDQDGNAFIEREIGPVIYRFEIHEAIRRGILCELDYQPLEYQFSDADRAAVKAAYARQAGRVRGGSPDPKPLWMDLAKVKKLSKEKIPLFRDYVARDPDILRRCILFVEQADYGALLQPILGEHGLDFHTYYGDDDRENLPRFAHGELDCLIACKRISEGIDIQSINNIVLFATAKAPIETVQRVGRCLRIDPGNPGKRARVIDFIRTDEGEDVPAEEERLSTDEERRTWFEGLAAVQRTKNGADSEP